MDPPPFRIIHFKNSFFICYGIWKETLQKTSMINFDFAYTQITMCTQPSCRPSVECFLGEFINFFYLYYTQEKNKQKKINKKKLTKKNKKNDFNYSYYTPQIRIRHQQQLVLRLVKYNNFWVSIWFGLPLGPQFYYYHYYFY